MGEYDQLESLISVKLNERHIAVRDKVWGKHDILEWWFRKMIISRRSLQFANWSILFSVTAMIGCTFLTLYDSQMSVLFDVNNISKGVWIALFLLLSMMSLLPLCFIKMGTFCETYLYGDGFTPGKVSVLITSMLSKKTALDALLLNSAQIFKAPPKN